MFKKRPHARALSRKLQSHRRGQTLVLSSPRSFVADGSPNSSGTEFQSEPLFHDAYISPTEERSPQFEPVAKSPASFHESSEYFQSPDIEQMHFGGGNYEFGDYKLFEVLTATSVVFYKPGKPKLVDITPAGSHGDSFLIQSSASSDSDVRVSGFYRSRSTSVDTDSSNPDSFPETPLTSTSIHSPASTLRATFKKDCSTVYHRVDPMSPSKVVRSKDGHTVGQGQSWFAHDDSGLDTDADGREDQYFANQP